MWWKMGFSIEFSLQTFSDFFAQVTKFKKKKIFVTMRLSLYYQKRDQGFPGTASHLFLEYLFCDLENRGQIPTSTQP